MGRNDRPEHTAPPEIFYNEDEARKYTENSRIIAIQRSLTERALELLALPQDGSPKLLLDLGCGSGLSGETLTDEGHVWVVRLQYSYTILYTCIKVGWFGSRTREQ
jgi:18S rRNA (guanine1575-N7)-methyltransferase